MINPKLNKINKIAINFSKENYIYKTSNTPQFKDFKITELIMGLNRDTHDSIFYISFEHPNKNKMQFVHLSINGEISSSLKLKGQAEPSYFYKPIFPSSYDGSYKYGESETFERRNDYSTNGMDTIPY